jgi:hypothetical protein
VLVGVARAELDTALSQLSHLRLSLAAQLQLFPNLNVGLARRRAVPPPIVGATTHTRAVAAAAAASFEPPPAAVGACRIDYIGPSTCAHAHALPTTQPWDDKAAIFPWRHALAEYIEEEDASSRRAAVVVQLGAVVLSKCRCITPPFLGPTRERRRTAWDRRSRRWPTIFSACTS